VFGSVRQTLDDAGAVLDTTSYDPWGTPQDTLSAPFGFTGELHHQGQVYLRARWYAPGQGRFVSEDPFAGYSTRPYSLHPYQYGYAAPTVYIDPTGTQGCHPEDIECILREAFRETVNPEPFIEDVQQQLADAQTAVQTYLREDLPISGWGLVKRLAEPMKATATFHAPQTGVLDPDTFAILMGAIVALESGLHEVLLRPIEDAVSNVWLGEKHRNATTGIANLTPSATIEILNGDIPIREGGVEQTLQECVPLIYEYTTQHYGDMVFTTPRGTFTQNHHTNRVYRFLQNDTFSLDLLGANINRGIHRARALGIRPSLFNLATWHNRGVQTVDGIRAQGAMGYGSFIIQHFPTSANALGLSIPAGIPGYNLDEAGFIPEIIKEEARIIGIGR